MTPKDVLIFESEAFSIEPPLNEKGISYDLPLGDDLAAFLRQELVAMNAPWSIDEPVLEDFGSVLLLDQDRKHFTITITWIVGPNQRHWAIQFHQSHGCLGLFVKRRTDLKAMEQIKAMTDQVIFGRTDKFQSPKWLPDSEFTGIWSSGGRA